MRAASYDMKGTYGAHYGFKLDGVTKEQIPAEGAVLVSVTEELEEALKDAAPVSSVKAKASVENTVVVRDAQAQNALLMAARAQAVSYTHLSSWRTSLRNISVRSRISIWRICRKA